MTFTNPYIEKIKNNPHIIEDKENTLLYKWRWNEYFKNNYPIYLEIWTGLWNFFSSQVKNNPHINFIGMEIKFKRVYKTSEKSSELWNTNFVVLKRKWQEIDEIFWPWEIERSYIFFPDPWEKKDYQKKNKLLQVDFLRSLAEVTNKWWFLIFKTDHRKYFDEVLETLKKISEWHILRISYDYEKDIETFNKQNLTEFEALFRGEKKKICYLEVKKCV